MTRIIFSTAIASLLAIGVSAQTSITSQFNGYRDGDKLYRIVANDTTLGGRGENCIWELPPVENSDELFKQTIYLRNDSLTIVENDLMLHYIANERELSLRGYQTRDMCSVQDSLLPELRYPFAYGDSINGSYTYRTTYYNTFNIKGEGSCYTVCDGHGVLTDGIETLKDVLRVHHHNTVCSVDSIMDDESTGSVVTETTEDKFLWYCAGSRYPVMDTRIIRCKVNGEMVSDTTFTSLYMPELQISELAYDDANSQLIAQRASAEHAPGQNGSDYDDGTSFPITMSATLQPGYGEISLNYTVAEEIDAAFYAYDLAGRLLGSVTHLSLSPGEYHETMILDRRPINNVVMLTMIAGEKRQSIKVS